MRFDEVLPSIAAGKKARRAAWEGRRYVQLRVSPTGSYPDTISIHDIGSEGTWPSVPERGDVLADDWELLPWAEPREVIPYAQKLALDMLTADLSASSEPEGRTADELALAAITALVTLRGRDDPETRLESLRKGAAMAFLALAELAEGEASRRSAHRR